VISASSSMFEESSSSTMRRSHSATRSMNSASSWSRRPCLR
jgi:hypothetical protein